MNKTINAFIMAVALGLSALAAGPALAQGAATAPAATANEAAPAADSNASAASAYEHLKPVEGIGMPKSGKPISRTSSPPPATTPTGCTPGS